MTWASDLILSIDLVKFSSRKCFRNVLPELHSVGSLSSSRVFSLPRETNRSSQTALVNSYHSSGYLSDRTLPLKTTREFETSLNRLLKIVRCLYMTTASIPMALARRSIETCCRISFELGIPEAWATARYAVRAWFGNRPGYFMCRALTQSSIGLKTANATTSWSSRSEKWRFNPSTSCICFRKSAGYFVSIISRQDFTWRRARSRFLNPLPKILLTLKSCWRWETLWSTHTHTHTQQFSGQRSIQRMHMHADNNNDKCSSNSNNVRLSPHFWISCWSIQFNQRGMQWPLQAQVIAIE